MAIRFRKTFKVAPGVKLNLGKRGASVRVGGKNAGFTTGSSGSTVSASIPKTGLGVSQRIGKSAKTKSSGSQFLGTFLAIFIVMLVLIYGFHIFG